MANIGTNKNIKATYDELWKAWEPLSEKDIPADGSVSEETALARTSNLHKLSLYQDIVNFFSKTGRGQTYEKLMDELKGPGMRQFDLTLRLKRAEEGKEAASKKYKEKNWHGAMYTYTIAWGCFMPYYPECLPVGNSEREKMIKLELALISNISAMTLSAVDDKEISGKDKPIILQLGLRACLYILGSEDDVTVGIMMKTCRRAADIAEKLKTKFKEDNVPMEEIRYWKAQELALKGESSDKKFKDVPANKKVKAPTTTTTSGIGGKYGLPKVEKLNI